MGKTNPITVENSNDLKELLNSYLEVHRNKAVIEGMKAGANLINEQARAKLKGKIIGKGNYSHFNYDKVFKMENAKPKNENETGVRTGVWDKENGHILRWLEWGTRERYTHDRKNKIKKTVTPKMYRGKMRGNNYFFGTVRDKTDEVFKVVSEAIIKSLEESTFGGHGKI